MNSQRLGASWSSRWCWSCWPACTAAAEAALYSFSKARADRLVAEGCPGAARVRKIADDPPRYLNTALLLRTIFEISAIVLVALVVFGIFSRHLASGC